MEPTNEIIKELSDISKILVSADRRNSLYQVPAGYFENFADTVMTRIRLSAGPLVEASDEIEQLSPLLAAAKRSNPYTVPEGYFNDLTKALSSSHTLAHKPAIVVPLQSRRSAWYKYAAAAVVAGVIATAGFFIYNNNHQEDPVGTLGKLSDQEMVNYLQNEDLPLAEAAAGNTAAVDFNDTDIKDLLSDVSDNELQQYAMNESTSPSPSTIN